MTTANFTKLRQELEAGGTRIGGLRATDDWTVKQLLAVRAWWSESVVRWIEEGRRGGRPTTPAEGYSWKETPRLNNDIARRAKRESFASVVARLDAAYGRVLALIEELDDHELLDIGAFEWAGKYPIARWLSLNTTRQYATARTFVRKAQRHAHA